MKMIRNYHQQISIAFISIMYLVGIVQLSVFSKPSIIELTPMQLGISAILMLIYTWPNRIQNLFGIGLIYVLGFGIELLGVNTGFPFGEYSYGTVLGTQWKGTPWMIGINWILIVVGGMHLCIKLVGKRSALVLSIFNALFALVLDFLIEPVAIHYDMWSWSQSVIPLKNYISWALLAFIMSYIYVKMMGKDSNVVVRAIYLWMALFFIILNLKIL